MLIKYHTHVWQHICKYGVLKIVENLQENIMSRSKEGGQQTSAEEYKDFYNSL